MKHRRLYPALLCALLALPTACSEDPESPQANNSNNSSGSNNTNNSTDETPDVSDASDTSEDVPRDDSAPDMAADAGADEGMDATSCEPLTVCPADACGSIDDTCGGQLECEVCACEGGQPQQDACDACGLFAPQCDGDELTCKGDVPDAVVSLAQTQCATSVLYVASGGQGDGTKSNPMGSLTQALDAARAANQSQAQVVAIALQGSATYEGESMEVVDGVSILGGYAADWSIDERERPIILGTITASGDAFGLRAANINTPTMLRHLIVATQAAGPGANTYGLHVSASRGLALFEVDVTPGPAGAGAPGAPGAAGYPESAAVRAADARLEGRGGGLSVPDGGDGKGSTSKTSFTYQIQLNGGISLTRFGDRYTVLSPPSSVVANQGKNAMCPQADGGAGGEGATRLAGDVRGSGSSGLPDPMALIQPAQAGSASPAGAQGGAFGTSGVSSSRRDGKDGTDGAQTSAVPDGVAGGLSVGEVEQGLFVAPNAQGVTGVAGAPGAGGGGGGGAYLWNIDCANNPEPLFCIDSTSYYDLEGPQGGGGGAGGCGGQGGQGGQGGGSSIALLAIDSAPLKVRSSRLRASNGARGGDGGQGGQGGLGAQGGVSNFDYGGNRTVSGSFRALMHPVVSSGAGGAGAQGQAGGVGGGGAGGSSFGAYCVNTTLDLAPNAQPFVAGSAGEGGKGGRNAQGDVIAQSGQALDQFGCE